MPRPVKHSTKEGYWVDFAVGTHRPENDFQEQQPQKEASGGSICRL